VLYNKLMPLMSQGHLKFTKLLFIAAIFALAGFFPFEAGASSTSSTLVRLSPANPSPGENTTISLSSYANDLDSVPISWSVSGKKVSAGVGEKSISVTAPAAGTSMDVVATISFPDGMIDVKIVIKPAAMTLLWQAVDSYTPPFYKGKALPTADSEIKVVAMPEVKVGSSMVDPAKMVYSWKKDYKNDQGASGYGKNFFTYLSDYLEDSNRVSVMASTTNNSHSSEKALTIEISQPKIIFYKNDPSLGTFWEKSISNGYRIQGNEILQAAPYFISPGDIRIPILVFNWLINDQMVSVDSLNKNLLPLSAPSGTSGAARVKLQISNTYKIFENSSKEISVNF